MVRGPIHYGARVQREEMEEKKSNKCNRLDRGPSRTTWPPRWLTEPCPPALNPPAEAVFLPVFSPKKPPPAVLPGPPADVSSWELPPDLAELWEERVCIMHYDGGLPWPQAEAEALADVLRDAKAGTVQESTAAVQTDLFVPEGTAGPYGRGL
jgi:hypothetical protein